MQKKQVKDTAHYNYILTRYNYIYNKRAYSFSSTDCIYN